MNVQTHTLSNGMRIVTEAMPGLQSATIGIWVMAGGRHERIEQNGIAHFLEHMAFKGTTTRSALQIAEAIEDVGGYINAYTSREMTAYYARVLGEHVPLGLDIIGDILNNSVFDPKEIEVERGVILQEIGQSYDTPDDIVFDWLQEAAFPDQAMGRTILGPTERVSNFGREDLSGFISEHYSPSRMILSAAGAVDHDAIVRQAEALFGHLERRENGQLIDPARFSGRERRELKTLEQVHFALAFEGPDYRGEEIFVAQIYAAAMGGGMSSRLFQEIRENRGLCYSIFTQAGAYSDIGMMTLYAGTSASQIEELALVSMNEIKRSADQMTETEVARARAQMKAGLMMGLESPSARAERIAHMIHVHGRVPTLNETTAMIDSVTVEKVRDFAGGLIDGAGMALALYGPAEKAPTLEALKERLVA